MPDAGGGRAAPEASTARRPNGSPSRDVARAARGVRARPGEPRRPAGGDREALRAARAPSQFERARLGGLLARADRSSSARAGRVELRARRAAARSCARARPGRAGGAGSASPAVARPRAERSSIITIAPRDRRSVAVAGLTSGSTVAAQTIARPRRLTASSSRVSRSLRRRAPPAAPGRAARTAGRCRGSGSGGRPPRRGAGPTGPRRGGSRPGRAAGRRARRRRSPSDVRIDSRKSLTWLSSPVRSRSSSLIVSSSSLVDWSSSFIVSSSSLVDWSSSLVVCSSSLADWSSSLVVSSSSIVDCSSS